MCVCVCVREREREKPFSGSTELSCRRTVPKDYKYSKDVFIIFAVPAKVSKAIPVMNAESDSSSACPKQCQ